MSIKPIFVWEGGKWRHRNSLLPKIPPHTTYIEVFAGTLALLCAKPPSKVEVINDSSNQIVTLYRVVRYHCDELIDEYDHYLNSREHFELFQHERGLTDIQRSARWLFRNRMGFGSRGENWPWTKLSGSGSAHKTRKGFYDSIRSLRNRLDGVVIENKDWREVVRGYDHPDAFFFFDPPYISKHPGSTYDPWTVSEMQALADCLAFMQGKWLVTVDDNRDTRMIFNRWKRQHVSVRNNGPRHEYGKGKPIGELIIEKQPA